jgi:D-arabinose 1-dehydrogenase-like Zn-dependent alcohol dehydrogenase
MRVAQVPQVKGVFQIVDRPIPEPGAGWVRIKVEACGVCHSDSLVKEGGYPGLVYPRVPGHEVAGSIDAVGPGVEGTLLLLGVPESLQMMPVALIMGSRSVRGWYSGTSIDSEETAAFSARTAVRSMNELYPLERAGEAYDRMMSGKARFRVVLTMPS